MAGLGLVHFGFLAAMLAVGVPVLIHLLMRPRARRVDIGTLRFLKLVQQDSSRSKRLRRWLLLALRCAAVLLLALLFARPYLRGLGMEGTEHEVLILIDQSASMRAVHAGRTLFARAREEAEKILRGLPEGTEIHLAYFDAQGVAGASDVRIDAARQAGFAAADYGLALRWARDRALTSARAQRSIYLITDLQRSGLRDPGSLGWPPDLPLEIVEVGVPAVRNLTIASVESQQTTLRKKEPVLISANVFNAGAFDARDVSIRLLLEGPGPRLERNQKVSIAGGSQQEVRFEVPIERTGLYTGQVEVVADDDLSFDDRRWLAFEARPADKLLLVDGKPGRTVYAHETYYLEAALKLSTADEPAALTPYEPERLAWSGAATLPELAPYRAVILCNVADLGESSGRLSRFVAEGGALLVFTGSQVRPGSFRDLIPATVEETLGPDLYRFDSWDKEHPILRVLSDPQQGDLRRVGFRFMTRLKPNGNAKVLARTQQSDPLIIEGRIDKGTVLVMASSVQREWSDWPQSRLFLPLVHQLVGYLTERLPENQRVRELPCQTDTPAGISTVDRATLVRNLDPRESEVERLSVDQFRRAFHLPDLRDPLQKDRDAAAAGLPPGGQRPDELWVYVIVMLFIILLIEVFVANRTHA